MCLCNLHELTSAIDDLLNIYLNSDITSEMTNSKYTIHLSPVRHQSFEKNRLFIHVTHDLNLYNLMSGIVKFLKIQIKSNKSSRVKN